MFISTPDLFEPFMTTPTPKLYKRETRYLETHFGRKYYVLTLETIPLIPKHLGKPQKKSSFFSGHVHLEGGGVRACPLRKKELFFF